ncbi:MAG TPA: helix-turn-helix domain-containing protein, partial [Saprospiraceae bacterium]|nr:helix-turn-helix domain-containing protein [Saprospiraceae bacterium]
MRANELILLSRDQVEEIVIDAVKTVLSLHAKENAVPGPAMPVVMTLEQVCRYTGLSKDAIYRKTGAGLIPHSKRGKRLYFDRGKIDAWLLGNSVD